MITLTSIWFDVLALTAYVYWSMFCSDIMCTRPYDEDMARYNYIQEIMQIDMRWYWAGCIGERPCPDKYDCTWLVAKPFYDEGGRKIPTWNLYSLPHISREEAKPWDLVLWIPKQRLKDIMDPEFNGFYRHTSIFLKLWEDDKFITIDAVDSDYRFASERPISQYSDLYNYVVVRNPWITSKFGEKVSVRIGNNVWVSPWRF